MKFGVLSTAHFHVLEFVENMLQLGGEWVGIVNDGTPNFKALMEKYNPPVVSSAQELVASGIELAGSFAPNQNRIDEVELCSQHGVHVMSDKPLVLNQKDLNRLDAVLSHGSIELGMMFTVRFMPSVWELKQVIDRGEIGDLVNIEIFNPHRLMPANRPEWFFRAEESGSIVVDLFTHSVDLLYWLSGRDPIVDYQTAVTKSILKDKPEFFDIASSIFRTQGGKTGYFRVDWHIPDSYWTWGDMRIFCIGTKGYCEVRSVGDPITKQEKLIVFSPEQGAGCRTLPVINDNCVSDFVKRIRKQPCQITQEDIRYTCQTVLNMEQNMWNNNRFV